MLLCFYAPTSSHLQPSQFSEKLASVSNLKFYMFTLSCLSLRCSTVEGATLDLFPPGRRTLATQPTIICSYVDVFLSEDDG